MIKLPIRSTVATKQRWQATLQNAVERLAELEKAARTFENTTGRYIRPIMLIRVDRTGNDQREKGGDLVHSENVFEYLTAKSGRAAEAIRRQTAETEGTERRRPAVALLSVRFIHHQGRLARRLGLPVRLCARDPEQGHGEDRANADDRPGAAPAAGGAHWCRPLDQTHVFCAEVDGGRSGQEHQERT